jgi:hypothetical protein
MLLYSNVVLNRSLICEKFPHLIRKQRVWQNYYHDNEKVLNFGSGNVEAVNHKEIKNLFKNVFSCDSDPSSGADYNSLDLINDKFDLIICEHILEHITVEKMYEVAKKFDELLNDNGKLLVTLPNVLNFGSYFSHYDHKNYSPPIDIAAIICCVGFDVVDMFKWSKEKHMVYQSSMNETEKFLEYFLEKNYGLQTDKYITIILQKNGKI